MVIKDEVCTREREREKAFEFAVEHMCFPQETNKKCIYKSSVP